jgi:PAS domain S-box-containing protein
MLVCEVPKEICMFESLSLSLRHEILSGMSTEKLIRILHIERDGRKRAAVASGLPRHGFVVVSAVDGTTGISIFRENACEMLLCKSRLTGAESLEIFDQIRKDFPDTPIVLLAARWSLQVQLEAIRLGVIYCVTKPLRVDALAAILRHAWEENEKRHRMRERVHEPANSINDDKQLRIMVDASPTPTVVSRISDGRILFANEHLARLVGANVEELIGSITPDFYYLPEERSLLLDRLRRDRLLRNYELQLKRTDGTPFWALISIVATEFGGEPVLIAGISDISDRKSAEEALQRERNFVSAVLDTEGALVAVLDLSGGFVRFNRACEQITGFTYSEIKGRPFWEVFLLPEETERVRCIFNDLCAGKFPNRAENYWRTKYGSLRLISWSNTVMLNADGKAEYIIATGIDITEQRKAEEDLRRAYDQMERHVMERTAELAAINGQLRESERRLRKQNAVLSRLARQQIPGEDLSASLRNLTEAAAETMEVERASVWIYDEGFSRIICLDLFERSTQTHSAGQELSAVDYPEYFSALGEQRAIAADDARSDSRTREFTDSYLIPLEITSMLDAPIWLGGKMAGVICHEHIGAARRWTLEEQQFTASLADYASLAIEAQHRRRAESELQQAHAGLERRVEERTIQLREAQAQLVQSEKMAALGMLVAGIAHEINTPVGAIHSMHDTLQRAVQKLRTELEQQCAPGETISSSIESIVKIIEEAILVITSGTGRVIEIVRRLRSFARLDEAELKLADIREGLEDTLGIIHHELKHGITVRRNYGDVAPFACYPGRLNQVFLNVLINARQALDGHGEISIKTYREHNRAFIEIADNGSGIAPEHLRHIFDPGFTTKGVGVGTGLGLSICYQIVRDHKGEIKVSSEIGKGTVFTIILPMDLRKPADER